MKTLSALLLVTIVVALPLIGCSTTYNPPTTTRTTYTTPNAAYYPASTSTTVTRTQ